MNHNGMLRGAMLRRSRLQWFERAALATTLLVFVCAFRLELVRMRGTLPYPQHVDERAVLEAAGRIVQSGDWNPHEYHYPSLPIYLTTGTLIVGLIEANSRGPERIETAQLGRVFGNYYEQPAVLAVTRTAWASLGMLSLAAAALLAWRCSGVFGLLFASAVLLVGAAIRGMASSYVNVDTPMCTCMALCMLHLVRTENSARLLDKVWLPGLLCGAAIACKYTAVGLLVPCVLSAVLWSDRDRLLRGAGVIFAAFATFCILCPYFMLDLPHFLDGLINEAYHYGVAGHRNHDVEPGLPQLAAYTRDVLAEYGLGIALLSLLGLLAIARASWRRAIVLVSLPMTMLALLCGYRVHFFRNALPLQMIVPVFAAAGAGFAFRALWVLPLRALAPRTAWATPLRMQLLAAGAIGVALLPGLPLERARASYRNEIDSRNKFVMWAKHNLPKGSNLILPSAMPFASTLVRPDLNPAVLDLQSEDETRRLAVAGNYMLLPHWNQNRGWAAEQLARISAGLHALPRYQVIQRFDGVPLIPAKRDRDTRENPAFDLVRFY